MRYSELKRRLRRLGFDRLDEGKKYEIWGRRPRDRTTVIGRHDTQEVPTGTLVRIMRDLDLRLDDLR